MNIDEILIYFGVIMLMLLMHRQSFPFLSCSMDVDAELPMAHIYHVSSPHFLVFWTSLHNQKVLVFDLDCSFLTMSICHYCIRLTILQHSLNVMY